MKHEVWMEGYVTTGNESGASYCGSFEGKTFEEACVNWVNSLPKDEKKFFRRENLTFWGCKLYDNETRARKCYG